MSGIFPFYHHPPCFHRGLDFLSAINTDQEWKRSRDPKSGPALVRSVMMKAWLVQERVIRPLRTVFSLSLILWCMFIERGHHVTTLGVSPHFPYKLPEIVYLFSPLEACWACWGLHYSIHLSGFWESELRPPALHSSAITTELPPQTCLQFVVLISGCSGTVLLRSGKKSIALFIYSFFSQKVTEEKIPC